MSRLAEIATAVTKAVTTTWAGRRADTTAVPDRDRFRRRNLMARTVPDGSHNYLDHDLPRPGDRTYHGRVRPAVQRPAGVQEVAL
jgi:hypothetical protein